jgi:hypothetical protein
VTRYDKLAANYLAFIQLASIRLWLRVNEFGRMRAALEKAGVEFINVDQPGVRFAKAGLSRGKPSPDLIRRLTCEMRLY